MKTFSSLIPAQPYGANLEYTESFGKSTACWKFTLDAFEMVPIYVVLDGAPHPGSCLLAVY